MRPTAVGLATVLLAFASSCGGSSKNAGTPSPIPTAPPPQAATTRIATPVPNAPPIQTAAVSIVTPAPPPPEVVAIVDKTKLTITELPREFGYGQFQLYQANEQAVVGYEEDPKSLLDRLNKTGRLGGFVQQLTATDSPAGGAMTIEVWKDAAGAKQYFDAYPRPSHQIQYQEITLPKPLGEQTYAYMYTLNGPAGAQSGYSIAWRNGRLILGLGETFPAGKETLDHLMPLAQLLDAKATAAQK